MLKRIYNNRYVGLFLVSLMLLFQHLQVMSFARYSMDLTRGNWNSDAKDTFGDLENLALRFKDDTFIGIYATALFCSFVSVIVYFVFHYQIHEANIKQNSIWTPIIWFWDHIIFGFGFIPIIANLTEVQYCDLNKDVDSYNDVSCWDSDHEALYILGFIGISFAFFMAGVVFPILKSERRGIEQHWLNESNFPGLYTLVLTGIVLLFAPIQRPWTGICAHAALIVYLFLFEGYRELHIASLKMGILWAQMWVFICSKVTEDSSDDGSDMLAGWIPFLVFGYAILPLKSLILKRTFKTLPLEVNYKS
mmetsp:Transcript_32396/g.56062  ORF Transcript_32396/g.56062 Transcript_32396/m.56062 type:complete len:306 (+) Transcript_32396:2567-3484(+)